MTNNSQQVFAGGWQQLQHAEHKSSTTSTIPNVRGLDLKPDGTKLWAIDRDTDEIIEFDIPTPWDSSTITTRNGNAFDIAANPTITGDTMAVQWDYDGMTCYLSTTTRIYQLDASTPHRADTLVYNTVFYEPTEETDDIQYCFILPFDPTTGKQKFYVLFATVFLGPTGHIYEYDMPSKGDLANSVYSGNFIDLEPLLGNNLRVFSVDTGGRYLYVYERNASLIHRFNFQIIKDISSVVITDDQLFTGDKESLVLGMFIRPTDGKKLYITGILEDKFDEYDMSLSTNNSLITKLGENLTTKAGELLVAK